MLRSAIDQSHLNRLLAAIASLDLEIRQTLPAYATGTGATYAAVRPDPGAAAAGRRTAIVRSLCGDRGALRDQRAGTDTQHSEAEQDREKVLAKHRESSKSENGDG